ncbi:MAG: chromate transporter, partial [Synergistaceae bacterium]|nr:chromate transporter [Synergistaceae bacterium]
AAGVGFLTVPIIIILIIAAFLTNFAELEIIQHAFAGIRVCVCVLIVQAVLRLWKSSIVDKITLALYLIIFILNAFAKIQPALLVIASGVLGVLAAKFKANNKSGD